MIQYHMSDVYLVHCICLIVLFVKFNIILYYQTLVKHNALNILYYYEVFFIISFFQYITFQNRISTWFLH